MIHEIQDNFLLRHQGWVQAKRCELSKVVWQRMTLFIVFGLLLVLVILGCTVGRTPLLSVVAITALAIVVGALLYPRFALILVFTGAGMPTLLVPLPGHTLRPIEVGLLLCISGIILRRHSMRLRLPHLLALLFMAIAVISFIHVPEFATSATIYGANKRLYDLALVFIAFYCGTLLIKHVKDISSFLVTVLLCNIPLFLISTAQALNIHLSLLLENSGAQDPLQSGGRIWGPFNGAVSLGLYLINLFAVAFACSLLGKRRRDRMFGIIMTIATAIEIAGSGTRSAAIAVIILFIATLLLMRHFKVLLSILALAGVVFVVFINHILPQFLHSDASTANRLFLWQEAIKLISTHPWIGIGLEQFHIYYAQLIISQSTQLDPSGISVHNQYLELAMEGGIFWLIVGVLLLISIALACWKGYRIAQSGQQILLLTTILAVVGNLISAFTDAPLDNVEGAVFLFLLAGLALGCMERTHRDGAEQNTISSLPSSPVQQSLNTTRLVSKLDLPQELDLPQSERLQIKLFTLPQLGQPRTRLFTLPQTEHLSANSLSMPQPSTAGTATFSTTDASNVGISSTATAPNRALSLTDTAPNIMISSTDTVPDAVTSSRATASNRALSLTDTAPDMMAASPATAPNMRKTSSSIILQLLSWGIAIPIIFPMTALLTRYLGPTQYGEYSFTIPFLAIVALFSGSGMDPLVIRQLSRQPRASWSTILSYAAGTRLTSTLLSATLACLLALILPISAEQRNLLLLGSFSLIFSFSYNGLRTVYEYGFRAEQRIASYTVIETINRVLTAGLVLVVVLFHLSLIWAFVLIVYSDLPFFLILVLIARRRYGVRLRFSLARAREHLIGSLSLMGYNALGLVAGQADLILLMVLTGPQNVGLYALASRIIDPLLSIAIAYVIGLYPLLCAKFEEGRKQFATVYQEAFRILLLGIIPLAIFVSTEAKAIVALLGGEHFAAAVPVVQLLMWAMVATFCSQLVVRTCMAADLERFIPYVTGASVGLNIVMNVLLIPHFQIVGAGIASVASEVLELFLFIVLLRHQVRLLTTLGLILRVLISNLPMLVFLLLQQQLALLVAAPIAVVLTIVGSLATRTFSLNDIRMIRQMLLTKRSKEPSSALTDLPTTKMPLIKDITDWPTVLLPSVRI
ncbi:MAG: hypothetical protein NVS4B7_08580 [Ktedonobacteraceae bacterium]